jgi:GT2 family glycosyltransferase
MSRPPNSAGWSTFDSHSESNVDHPEVGVVVATRNRRRTLLRTLAELDALPEHPPVVVVDNASTDGTAAAVASEFPGVDVLELDRNRGPFARNLGLGRLRTPLVAFSDDDSWWEPGALSRAGETFRRFDRVGLLAARILVGAERRLDAVSELMRGPAPPDLPGPRVHGFLACGAIVRRTAFLDAGGFDIHLMIGGEEELVAIEMRLAGWELCYADDVVAVHVPARGNRADRTELGLRNGLWTSWLRMPAGRALRDTAALARSARSDPAARRAMLGALRGLPWTLRRRRRVPDWILRERLDQGERRFVG